MSNQETFKDVVIVARIIDPVTEKVEHKHIKNIDDHERRVWLTRTVMWAVMNGKIIEIVNKKDDKEE